MREITKQLIQPKRLSYAVSVAMALMAADIAMAQDTKPVAEKAVAEQDIEKIVVVGARESQRSSINRKKRAATAMDSIIAEDVGAFPDRNVGEAISRIAGVAIDRGDFGEGTSVAVRGNGAELTRVEIDGQGVQSGGGTDLLGGGDGRGVEFREMSSDLIKSVDVVKGSTADMVEGSLGGGIIIKTRTGLDFKKPFYSVRLGATQSSVNKKTTPNLNLVLADKFLDNRMGVLVNLNKSEYSNESHTLGNGGNNNVQGQMRLIDFDNSPEKTFTFNPNALSKSDASVDNPLLASPLTAGGTFNSASPRDILTKSAAAQSKADCQAAFPALTTTQANAINGPTARAVAINQRSSELLSCLNQWNDYTPSIIRSYVKKQEDKRSGGDIRLDFKVNNDFSVYGKLSKNKRSVDDVVSNLGLGAVSVNGAGTFTDVGNVRTAGPLPGYTAYPSTSSFRSGTAPVTGAVSNVKPGYTVDDTHHVTSYSITDGGYSADMIFSNVKTDSQYLQLGGNYKFGDLKAEFFVGDARSSMMRHDRRANLGYRYGDATFSLLPNGAWSFERPDASVNDQLNYDNYAKLFIQPAVAAVPVSATNTVATPAYTSAQRPLITNSTGLQVIRVVKTETEEKTAKLDLIFNLRERIPFLTTFKGGFNLRNTSNQFWGLGGSTIQDPVGTFGTPGYKPGIYLPTLNAKSNVVGCEDTPGSLAAGGQRCQYGYNPSTNPVSPYFGTTVLTQAQYLEMVKQTLSVPPSGQFFGGAKGRPDGLMDGWTNINMDRLYQLAGINTHLDCVVRCTASDGNVYDQPISRYSEKSHAAYFMTDFDVDRLPFTNTPLPFGMELSGNMGWRVVKTDVTGTSQMTFTSIKINPATYNPLLPNLAGGFTSQSFRKNTSISDSSTDVLPIFNVAMWAIPNTLVLRYNQAKTVARPPMNRLLPSVTCINDERDLTPGDDNVDTDGDQRCTGNMGNPGIKPFTNTNKNLSLEWYANKDTMFSIAAFKQKGIIGAPNGVINREKVKVFEGSDQVDPVSGTRLADMEFNFSQWTNMDASTRRGVELASKTAFTFLPSVLRYTGLDTNYTRVRSAQGRPTLDLLTADELPVIGEPKYSYNASLWYDDGAFSARVALQVVAKRYSCFAPCTNSNLGVNNFPAEGVSSVRLTYNPGNPVFSDATRFIDAKMAYKFKNGMELFVEGRNLTNEQTSNSTGGYEDYSNGTPNLYTATYSGRRIMVGLNIRSPQ